MKKWNPDCLVFGGFEYLRCSGLPMDGLTYLSSAQESAELRVTDKRIRQFEAVNEVQTCLLQSALSCIPIVGDLAREGILAAL